jgi:aryl-alcohol dehydrogenase-like predicted oxidoreductase
LGINHIDTSQFYGPNVSNQLIRESLHPYPADLAQVSKVGARRDDTGAWLPAHEPDELRAAIEENLTSHPTSTQSSVRCTAFCQPA